MTGRGKGGKGKVVRENATDDRDDFLVYAAEKIIQKRVRKVSERKQMRKGRWKRGGRQEMQNAICAAHAGYMYIPQGHMSFDIFWPEDICCSNHHLHAACVCVRSACACVCVCMCGVCFCCYCAWWKIN